MVQAMKMIWFETFDRPHINKKKNVQSPSNRLCSLFLEWRKAALGLSETYVEDILRTGTKVFQIEA